VKQRSIFSQEDPFEPILRQLSEPPSSAAVVASQAGKQGSYFRRQASLPFPAAEAQGQQAPAAGAQEEAGQRGGGGGSVVERLVPDYDWEQDSAMTGVAFDYHFGNVASLANVVGEQVRAGDLSCPSLVVPLMIGLHFRLVKMERAQFSSVQLGNVTFARSYNRTL